MRKATAALATALMFAVAPSATAKPPSAQQIARAVAAAERSPLLWATINICNSRTHSNEIGVRGQIPSLGFATSMDLVVTLDSWSASTNSFVPINSPNAVDTVTLGTHSSGLEQGGTIFPFQKGETGLWNATIVFIWKRNGKIVGQTKRRTTAGHPTADYSSPPHYSAAQCRIS